VPGRTNDFQELITLFVQILREDRATPSAMAMSTVPGVGKREVDAALKCPSFGYAINRRTVGIVTNGRWKVLHAFDATIWSKPSGASAIDSCPTAR
jgi:hypothetical protein